MANYIETTEDIIVCLSTALEEGEPADVINVIGVIARSNGMTHAYKKNRGNPRSLYTSLSEKGNPSFATIFNALRSMGITLQAQQSITPQV